MKNKQKQCIIKKILIKGADIMYSFIGSIIALVLGYFIYGKFVEGVLV